MIQLAGLWLRYQPGSELAEWFRKRVGTLAGRTRRIAIVAMARKLLIALWRYVETGGWFPQGPRSGRQRSRDVDDRPPAASLTAKRGTRPFSSLEAYGLRVSGGSRLAGATPRA
jgi:hypothetical protein